MMLPRALRWGWIVPALWAALGACSTLLPDQEGHSASDAGGSDRDAATDEEPMATAGRMAAGSEAAGRSGAGESGAAAGSAGSNSAGSGGSGVAGAAGGGGSGAAGASGSGGAIAAGSGGASGSVAPGCGSGMHACADGCRADDDAHACGTDCEVCTAPMHSVAICEAGLCATRCELECPDRTCGRARFDFESDTIDGVELYASPAAEGDPIATMFLGRRVARVDVRFTGEARNIVVRGYPCSEAVDLRSRTLSARVRLEGPPLPTPAPEHSLWLHVWSEAGNFGTSKVLNPAANTWYTLSDLFQGDNDMQILGVGVFVHVSGTDWTGSVYIDDLIIE
jgi:hypothetical protein